MALGDRKIKLQRIMIPRPPAGGSVVAEIEWKLFVQDKASEDRHIIGGNLSLSLGTWAVAQTKTLATVMADAIAAINTDGSIPPHDSAS
jgi:hypothetical protein